MPEAPGADSCPAHGRVGASRLPGCKCLSRGRPERPEAHGKPRQGALTGIVVPDQHRERKNGQPLLSPESLVAFDLQRCMIKIHGLSSTLPRTQEYALRGVRPGQAFPITQANRAVRVGAVLSTLVGYPARGSRVRKTLPATRPAPRRAVRLFLSASTVRAWSGCPSSFLRAKGPPGRWRARPPRRPFAPGPGAAPGPGI